ncbi:MULTISPECIES: LacI family DNA-binding transcriptional regulator [Nocardiopsis]|uniref:Transcriptional regulator, LacI family n=1 Tax=Nocardiopsis dassonvillei (strain ATCC 23218 / DSM 43111 / CIP 107115 / JCM 7437 / KCTC 9190 / NBRC 14626 / NCTC 10488 / NRRL B-5397 / IMRU 509) TaxID=446468 RepID=D7AZG1_NOCDD|nr:MULTISPECIES: LacI family DNA-binding transcriptional regulator [Nocardiopsis]ADH66253.1 transcriptional regulator, LacI family [Nocardiopsis dassonvillei subsp. dassonvillei DSM 43111]APC34578.1 LacI family transcriptional regulator [Nocardiopsis dassonvillei]ASU57443.1 LacI family transcriptional regulator [Nocardiopsis dassonvillei]MCK9873587.1 LacI family transcriptional regulator [Nocardiopsis dassonvillei]NKY81766.1 LacI family transcriptional regulator [Nocardiopsis dassonvillei]
MAKTGAGRKRPTLEMVAQRAGVGRGTVSRVINGSAQVSPRTREAVHAAIAELGYSPNQAARTLVTRRTDTIALVVSEPRDRLFSDPFFADIIRGVSSVLHERDLQLMLTTARTEAEHKRVGDYLSGFHVDGALLISLHSDNPLSARLDEAGVPVVHGGRPHSPEQPAPYCVDIDNIGGARMAIRHLLERGCRRVAAITGPLDMNAGVERLRGYREVMAAAGLEVDDRLVVQGDFSVEGGAEAMERLLGTGLEPDAVFAASDMMALGGLRVLRARGLRVPEDVALVGYDDTVMAQHSDPPLTTIHQPTVQMGQEMARLLVDVAIPRTTEAETVMLGTHLVVRESG